MWDKIAGGVVGLGAGLLSPNPYGGTAYDPWLDEDTGRDMTGRSTSRVEGWASGNESLYSPADISRLTKGADSELEGAASGARALAGERSIDSGQGPMGGGLKRRLGEIDRSLIDAKRRQKGPLLANLAMKEPEYEMSAQNMLFGQLDHAQQLAYADYQRMEQMKAAKKAAGSALYRGLAGAAAGFGGNYGGTGAGSAAGGQSEYDFMGDMNAPFNEPDWGSYQITGAGGTQSPDPRAWDITGGGYDPRAWSFSGGQG